MYLDATHSNENTTARAFLSQLGIISAMKQPLHILLLFLALMLSACATSQNNHDPIEPVNRVTDSINDGIDRITLKPIAQGYTALVPRPMRTVVSNFYDNATYMNTVLNDFLQGKGQQGMQDFIRFLINSTLGLGGLVDVASSMGFDRHQEDFGQTLATWGLSQGAYVVYPLLGPTSLRDTPDFLTATATDPLFWAGLALAPIVTIPVTALKYINKRAELLEASDMRDELALDPYVFTREAWRQNREFMIYDGHPPVSDNDEEDWDDGWDEEGGEDNSDNTVATSQSANKAEIIAITMDKTASRPTTRISIASAPAPAESAVQTMSTTDNITISKTTSTANQASIYSIYLSSHYSEIEAAAEQGRINKLGITTTIIAVTLDQHVWHRLRAGQYNDKAKAITRLQALKIQTGLTQAWLEESNKK